MATTDVSIPMSTLLDLTRKYVNEYVSTTDDFSEETDELLKAHILAAAQQVAAAAPEHLVCVDDTDSTKTEKRPDGMYYTKTTLPTNCIRVVSVTSDSWKRPVVDILPITHPNAGKEFCQVAGLGSGIYNPHVYRLGDTLYAHAGEDSTFATSTWYIVEPSYDTDTDTLLNLQPSTKEAVCYLAASLYLGSVGDGNAQAAAAASNACIESWTSGEVKFAPPAVEQPQIQVPQE